MTDPSANDLSRFPVIKPLRKGWLIAGMVCALLGGVAAMPGANYLAWGYAFPQLADIIPTIKESALNTAAEDAAGPNTGDTAPRCASYTFRLSETPQPIGQLVPPSVPVALLAGMILFFLSLCLFIPAIINDSIVFYKAWQSIQPLRRLQPALCEKLLTPVEAFGFLFIPYFGLYWCFPASLRLESFGRLMAQVRGEPYCGPTRRWILFELIHFIILVPLLGAAALCIWAVVFMLHPEYIRESIPPLVITECLLFSIWFIPGFVTSWRLNRMIAQFSTPLPE